MYKSPVLTYPELIIKYMKRCFASVLSSAMGGEWSTMTFSVFGVSDQALALILLPFYLHVPPRGLLPLGLICLVTIICQGVSYSCSASYSDRRKCLEEGSEASISDLTLAPAFYPLSEPDWCSLRKSALLPPALLVSKGRVTRGTIPISCQQETPKRRLAFLHCLFFEGN